MIPTDVEKKLRQLVKENIPEPKSRPITQREKFGLMLERREPVCDVITLRDKPKEGEPMVFQLINGRWRNQAYETKRFERNVTRDKVREAAKERL